MDWDNLRYFLEVARCQRISVAAQRLGVQHSTVARRIQALEQNWACVCSTSPPSAATV